MFATSIINFVENQMPMVLSGVVGLGVLGIVLIAFRGKKKKSKFQNLRQNRPTSVDQENLLANRRTSVRREGPPVKVDIASPAFRNGKNEGVVLDRSTGGLRIAMDAGMAPGTTLQVRANHAPDTIPWVTVIVRSCKDTGEHYELGCEFEAPPPWNVLLLFG